jgi:hypothetical protein
MSIWKDGKPLFAGDKYADLSEEALYFIGGILKHAKTLNAFTNPSTNSYKRLIPGFEAPVLRAYSARNRSGCVRIPWTESPKAKRVEARFPDPSANPYLCFAALLMAGLDGIKNKIDPGEPMDKDLYDLPPEELEGIPTVCGSLREAMESSGGRSRLPAGRRRVHQGPDRGLHGAQVGRDLRLRAHAAPGRVQACTTAADGREIARPLIEATELSPVVRHTQYLCWHFTTVAIAAMAVFFFLAAATGLTAYATSATVLAMGFFVVGVGLVFSLGEAHARLPQGWLFLPVAGLGLAGLLL